MNKTVVAVIGCGRIAQNAHFPAFEKMENLRIKYACDLIIEKAQAMVDKYDFVEQAIVDYKQVLADSEVEAVFIFTPNDAHYTIAMDALAADKHVFCEKPVAVSYEKTLEMQAQAEKYGKILNIGVCNRYHRSVELLEQYNREGKFGNLYHVYCSFRSFRSIPGLGGPFTDKKQSGGGVLIDWGIHFLDLILYILGGAKIKTVSCSCYSEMAKDMKSYNYKFMWAEDTSDKENGINDVDDFVTGFIRTDKGTITLNGAWAQNIDEREMFVDFLGDKAGSRLTYCDHFNLTCADTLETTRSTHEIPDMYKCENEAFIESFHTGVKNKANIDNIVESMKLLDALYRSSELGEEVKF